MTTFPRAISRQMGESGTLTRKSTSPNTKMRTRPVNALQVERLGEHFTDRKLPADVGQLANSRRCSAWPARTPIHTPAVRRRSRRWRRSRCRCDASTRPRARGSTPDRRPARRCTSAYSAACMRARCGCSITFRPRLKSSTRMRNSAEPEAGRLDQHDQRAWAEARRRPPESLPPKRCRSRAAARLAGSVDTPRSGCERARSGHPRRSGLRGAGAR